MPICPKVGNVQRFWWEGAIVLFHRNLLNGPGVHLVHANKDGSCVLKTEASWRNINGILIRTRRHQLFLHFRRRPPYLRGAKR